MKAHVWLNALPTSLQFYCPVSSLISYAPFAAAFPADTVKMHLVPQDLKSLLFKERLVDLVFFSIRELNEAVAAHALRMVVGFLIINMFKMMVLVPKGRFADDTRFQQFL